MLPELHLADWRYEAGSGLAGWDTAGFESAWCPTRSELDRLHAGPAALR